MIEETLMWIIQGIMLFFMAVGAIGIIKKRKN